MRRKIDKILKASKVYEGAGVKVNRVFGFHDVSVCDPFLLLDHFKSDDPTEYEQGFPWHPHRGIETVTYLIKGSINHGDSLGNKGVINDGDVQWMTAGSGIIHQEMPQVLDRGINGFQLWVNLPKKDKMTAPRYQEIKADMIPHIKKEGVDIAVLCGTYNEIIGPVQGIYADPLYLDITLKPDTDFSLIISEEKIVFAYIYNGSLIDEERGALADLRALLFEKGDTVSLKGGSKGAGFLLISGRALKEPVAWQGPIVMNTEAELHQAFQEFHAGIFVKN
jgi:redox-sensitive bicupin YhaK (pirin superfamily)